MKIFETEDYFAKYDYVKPYFICVSDCESVNIRELIKLGGGSEEEFLSTKLVYPEMTGSASLRSEIASLYQTVEKDHVLVLGSPIEGIYLTMHALLQKGDHAIVLSPAYDALFNVAEHITGDVSRWFLKFEDKQWKMDFDALEKLIKRNTKLLIFNLPHNPTGFLPTKLEFERMLEIAEQNGVRIFSDEMYRGLEFQASDRLPSLADSTATGVALGGASKSLGLAGLRFGWLVTKDLNLYKRLFDLKNYTSMCSTQANEYLGKMAIRATPKLVDKNLKIIQHNLQVAENFFGKWKDRFDWIPPKAGPISVMKIHEKSAETFCHEMAERFGVVLLPIKFMGYEDQFARLGYGRLDFAECLEVFDKALTETVPLPPQ